MEKLADTQYAIHPLLQARWSPRAFAPTPIAEQDFFSLFEAARWSPSGGNLQPWAFVTAVQGSEAYQKLVGVLVGNNQLWAKNAPLLVLSMAQRERSEGKPNPSAVYDLGQAVAHLTFQAESLGISVHQMGGFDKNLARDVFGVPAEYELVTAIAIGYAGDLDTLSEDLRTRELAPRTRKPLKSFVFANNWGEAVSGAK